MDSPSIHTDEILLQLLTEGSESAFTDIYNRYWEKLYFIAHKHLKSPASSEEIVQEVFLTLWNKKKQLNIQSLALYLSAMTRYAVYKYLAKENKNHVPYEASIAGPGLVTADEEEAINNKLLLEIVEKLSNRLPKKCRLVFVYNKLFDQPLPQVARQLNISDKTAEAHLTKALKIIRGGLKDASFLFLII